MLSKNYTLGSVSSILRVMADEVAPDKVQDATIKDFVNLAINDVAEMLDGASAPDYGTVSTGSVSSGSVVSGGLGFGTFSVTLQNYAKITKVVDGTNGLVPPKKDYEFENLNNITQFASSVFHNQFGETLYAWKGANISSFGQWAVFYYRIPTPVAVSADFLDIRDKFIPLVIAKAKNMIYEMVGKEAPEAVTALIASQSQAIRQGNMEEMATIKDRQKTTRQ